MPPVDEETIELDGQPVFLRRAGDDAIPIIYLHGLPTSADDWTGPLTLGGGLAVDLPGFGRSGKRGDLDYSLAGHVAFLDRLLEELGIGDVRLCMHDWGAAAGLAWAMTQPERVQRLVIVNGVPLLHGFKWRGWARAIRAPVAGPVAVGSAYKPVVTVLSRRACAPGATLPKDFQASVVRHLDLGTERALLRLLRSAEPEVLAQAGADLGRIDAPALVLAGARDRWIEPRFAAGYAATLADATLETIEDAGHWPWIERPEVGERMIRHLVGDPDS